MATGPQFYDQEDVFNRYIQRREHSNSPNDTIEGPAFMEVLGDYRDATVLDLGCGDGRFGAELIQGGCRSYTGIEASQRMFAIAQEQLVPLQGIVHHSSIEEWTYPPAAFDLVISRLALHYVDDINRMFGQVYNALKPGGRFFFSAEHPVLTSSNEAATQSGIRLNWIVDNYFITGARDVRWMGSNVIKYHRTIEDYFRSLQQANFVIEQLREPGPKPEHFDDEELFQRRTRIPLFLLMSARRPSA